MVYQATLNDRRTRRPANVVARKVGDLTHDFVTLAELQGELLAEDARQAARGLILPGVLAAVAIVLLVAAAPLLMLAIAHLLMDYGELLPWAAYLVTGLCGLVTSGVLVFVARDRLRGSMETWRRSRDELVLNLRWLKQELTQHPRARDGDEPIAGRPTNGTESFD